MTVPDVVAAITPIAETLDRLGVGHLIGGSVASSVHGVARSTIDIDLVADLGDEHVRPLVSSLEESYYVEESAVREAVARRTSFNVIHLDTMLKVDVFVLRSDTYERGAFGRRREAILAEGEGSRRFPIDSPEDVILHKLSWYRSGGEVSERQWRDVIGVLQVQEASLDATYLHRWARHLGIEDLLGRAIREAR